MKESKKLKNLIQKDGDRLKSKHADFCQKMIDTYYSEEVAVESKKSFDFSRILSRRAVAGFALALVLVIALPIIIAQTAKIKNDRLSEANNGGVEITVPSNAEIVRDIDDNKYNINTDGLTKVSDQLSLTFGDHKVLVDADVEVYEDIRAEDGFRNFYYLTDVIEGNFYRLQIIFDKELERTSYLSKNQSRLEISGLEVIYSTVYVQNINTVYFFAEAQTENEILVISFSTSKSDCEKVFIDFLKDRIK